MAFCNNCGNQVKEGTKFCEECGAPIQTAEAKRKVIFEGELHKCPNCGEVLSAFSVTCPACGHELRGAKASSSVREFATRLADAENDAQRITYIQSFPIPNNKEDILEFMILASTNFDAGENLTGTGIKKDVSDAWLAKIEQCYQKAKLLFSNDTDFAKIQSVYSQTCSKVKSSAEAVKKDNLKHLILRTIGLWGGLLVLLIGFIIDIASDSANTSVFHLGGALVMIIGAFMIGRKSKEMIDVGIGAAVGVISLILGMLLQGPFDGNGSAMVLGGGATLIVVVVQLIRNSAKK